MLTILRKYAQIGGCLERVSLLWRTSCMHKMLNYAVRLELEFMKTVEYNDRKRYLSVVMAVAEGLWNGVVVSGVLAISAFLIKQFWLL